MGRLLAPLVLCAALIPLVHAGIEFTKPEPGETLDAGTAIEVAWKDGGDGPPLADLGAFELHLCMGGTEASMMCKLSITTAGQVTAGKTAQGMVGTDVGEDKPANAYFVRMIATATKGGTLTVYSPRFSYKGMKGKFDPQVVAGLKDIKGTESLPSVDTTTKDGVGEAPDAELFDVDYAMQTGPTRYAPMQPIPPTKVSKKDPTPLFPTSAVDVARTWLPIPKIQTTVTQSQTHKVESSINRAAAAPMPSDDMAKFLARWKD